VAGGTTIDRKNILWLIVLRLVVMLSLFLSTLIIQSASPFLTPLVPFYGLVLGSLVLSAAYLVLYAASRNTLAQAYLQIVLDLVVVTGLVYISGGLSGSFYFLYVFVILAGGVILPGRSAYLIAALAAIFFGIMVDGIYYDLIPNAIDSQRSAFAPGYVLFTVLMAWAVFFVIAFLIDRLMGNLRRAAESLRRAQKELEIKERLAVAGQQAATLAHEIRNPLAAIAGSVQALRGEVVLSSDQARLMDILLKESHRVSQTIEQFLTLASPERVAFTTMDLSELLRETLTLLRTGGELDAGIQVQGNFEGDAVYFYGNSNQFRQIFWNLTKNAAKAMPQGGTLTIDLLTPGPRELRIRFADDGRGMTEAERAGLFVPFQSGFDAGWGLGMALVRRIVEDYEGRIEVDSAPGRGTVISLIFPVRGGREREAAAS
jgi:two-component system sensor histidine kinase PilS (NtrC family)